MSEPARPSMQAVQKGLLIGVLIGLILGVVFGIVLAYVYVQNNPPVYAGGAYPNEMTENYKSHFLAMTIDSYLVNPQPEVAAERLKTFDLEDQVVILGERSAAYVAAGRGTEACCIRPDSVPR